MGNEGKNSARHTEDNFSFQVDLKRMIRLLSENLYSSADVFLWELLFVDNGIGLTCEEIHTFLSVIGQSSKRGEMKRSGFIG